MMKICCCIHDLCVLYYLLASCIKYFHLLSFMIPAIFSDLPSGILSNIEISGYATGKCFRVLPVEKKSFLAR